MIFGVIMHHDGGGVLRMLVFLHVGLIWVFCMNECWSITALFQQKLSREALVLDVKNFFFSLLPDITQLKSYDFFLDF